MDKRERLAIAATHGVDPTRPSYGGGTPDITAEDIAGAMGMGHLSRLQAEILYVSYCGYPRNGLWSLTLLEIERWHPEWLGHQIAHRIARVALDVVVPPDRQPGQAIPPHRCQHCGGTGTDHEDPKKPTCPSCGGSGIARAQYFGRTWDERLLDLIEHLEWLEDEAITKVKLG